MPMTDKDWDFLSDFSSKPIQPMQADYGDTMSHPVWAPFVGAQKIGGMIYGNVAMPALQAVGLAREDSVAGNFNNRFMLDPSWEGIKGIFGQSETRTGYVDEYGNPIGDPRQTTFETILRHQDDPAVTEFAQKNPTAWAVGNIAGEIALDPLNVTALGGGVRAAWQASKIRAGLKGITGVGEAADAQRAEYLAEQLGNLSPQGQSRLERFGRAILGEEQASDFFQPGRVFNRTPEYNMAGEVGPETLRSRMGLNLMDRLAERMYPDASADFLRRSKASETMARQDELARNTNPFPYSEMASQPISGYDSALAIANIPEGLDYKAFNAALGATRFARESITERPYTQYALSAEKGIEQMTPEELASIVMERKMPIDEDMIRSAVQAAHSEGRPVHPEMDAYLKQRDALRAAQESDASAQAAAQGMEYMRNITPEGTSPFRVPQPTERFAPWERISPERQLPESTMQPPAMRTTPSLVAPRQAEPNALRAAIDAIRLARESDAEKVIRFPLAKAQPVTPEPVQAEVSLPVTTAPKMADSIPLGLSRNPVVNPELQVMDDAEFAAAHKNATRKLDALEKEYDDNPALDNDNAFRSRLAKAQDEYDMMDNEVFRRDIADRLQNGDSKGVIDALRSLNLKIASDKLKAISIVSEVSKTPDPQSFMSRIAEYIGQDDDIAEIMSSVMRNVTDVVTEAGQHPAPTQMKIGGTLQPALPTKRTRVPVMPSDLAAEERARELALRPQDEAASVAKPEALLLERMKSPLTPKMQDYVNATGEGDRLLAIENTPGFKGAVINTAKELNLDFEMAMSHAADRVARDMPLYDPEAGLSVESFIKQRAAMGVQDYSDSLRGKEGQKVAVSLDKALPEGEGKIGDVIAAKGTATPADEAVRAESMARAKADYEAMLNQIDVDMRQGTVKKSKGNVIKRALEIFRDMGENINIAEATRMMKYEDFETSETMLKNIKDDLPNIAKRAGVESSTYLKTVRQAFVRGVAKSDLLKAPGVKAVEDVSENDFRVTFENGKTIDVRTKSPIELRSAPDLVAGRTITVNDPVTGTRINVDYTKFADQSTINHEHVHVARSMGLFTDAEWQKLVSTYAKNAPDDISMEEAIANGLEKVGGALAQRIKEFFGRLYEAVTGDTSAWATQGRWRKGEMFRREKVGSARTDGVRYSTEAPNWRMADDATRAFADKIQGATPSPTSVTMKESLEALARPGGIRSVVTPIMNKLASQITDTERYLRINGWRLLDVINRKHGVYAEGGDIAAQGKTGVSKMEMKYDTLAGMNSRVDAIINGDKELGLYENGVYKIIMEKRNFRDSIIGPMERFLGKRASEGDYKTMIQLADTVAVAQRVRGERDAMIAAIDRIASRKGTDYDFIRLQKMGIDDAVALKDGLKADPEGAIATLRAQEAEWEKNMLLKTGDDYETALKVIEEQREKGLLTEGDKPGVLDEVLAATRDLSKAALDYAEKSGLISKAMAAEYRKSGDYYTPLQRVFDEFEQRAGRGSGTGGFTHQAMGSERIVMSPVGSVFDQLNAVIRKADENAVWRETVDTMAETKDTLAELTKSQDALRSALQREQARAAKATADNPVDNADTIADFEEQIRQYDEAMQPMKEYIADTEKVMVQVTDAKDRISTDVIPVVRDGKTTYWRFTDEDARRTVASMMTHMQESQLEYVAKLPGRLLRGSLTASPRFALFNFIRDSFMRPMISAHGGTPWEAITQRKANAAYEEQFYRSGGAQDVLGGNMEDYWRKTMEDGIRKVSRSPHTILARGQDFADLVRGGWSAVKSFTGKGEKMNRLAEYRNAYEYAMKNIPGITQEDAELYAAHNARGLLDFAQGGSLIRQINKYIPFTNAAVQGSRVMIRAMMRDPKVFTKNFGKYLLAPTMVTYAFAAQQGRLEEYRALPAYRRDFFWNIPVPGTNWWITFPKPFEMGVAATTIERITDRIFGNKDAFAGHLGSLWKGLVPVDEAAILGPMKPIIEVMANRNLFYDQPIIPYWEEGLDVRLRKGAQGGSRVGQTLQSVIGVDPRNVDHLISSFLGDYGRIGTNIAKIGLDVENPMTAGKTLAKALGVARETSPYELQPAKEAMRTQQRLGVQATKPAKAFRDILKEAQSGKRTMREAIDAARAEKERLKGITIEQRIKEMQEKAAKKK